jgi:hypothetical protein
MTNGNDSADTALARAIAHNGRVLATLDVVTASWRVVAAETGAPKAAATRRRRRRRAAPAASP